MVRPPISVPSAALSAARPASQTERFLHSHFSDQQGWLCLGWIAGDPRIEPMRQQWYELPRQTRQALQVADYHAAQGHNLYAAPCLFSQPKRTYATALPCPWLWFDDVAPDDAFTEIVCTSEGNYQGWRKLDTPLPVAERSHMQRALGAAAGADTCSSDAVHMARLPGGYNCKRHGAHLVTLLRSDGPISSADALRATLPPMPEKAARRTKSDDDTTPSGALWEEARHWLGNKQIILGADGMPRRCKPTQLAYRVLKGQTFTHDTSDARYIVAKGLMLYSHCTDGEIAAILTLFDFGCDKGSAWLYADIERILGKLHTQYPDVIQSAPTYQAKTPAAPAAPLPTQPAQRKSRAHPGRPAHRPAGTRTATLGRFRKLLHSLAHDDQITGHTLDALADKMKCSRRSIQNYLAALRAGQEILTPQASGNGRLIIILLSAFGAQLRSATRAQRSPQAGTDRLALSAFGAQISSATGAQLSPQAGIEASKTPEVWGANQIAVLPEQMRQTDDRPATGSEGREHTAPPCPPVAGAPAVPVPCPAIWHAGAADYPVLITGVAGSDAAGETYVWAQAPDGSGSQTGLPWSEVELTPPAAPAAAPGAGCVPPAAEPLASGFTLVAVEPPPAAAAPSEPAPAAVTLANLVRDCFDAYEGSRITWRSVARYVAMNAPAGLRYSEAGLRWLVDKERRRRRWVRQLAQLTERARQMRLAVLKRRAASTGGRYNDLLRRGKEREASVWRQIAGVFEAEIMRRCDRETEDAQIDLEIARQAERRQPAPVPAAPAPVAAVEIGAAQERLPGLVVEEGGSSAAVPGTVAHLLAALVRQAGQRAPSRVAGAA